MATVEDLIKTLDDTLKEARIAAVSVTLPTFWPDKAVLWFTQAEAQFLLRNITADKTKFAHVLTMLDSKTAEHAMDIIEAPPDVDAYKTLKSRLTGAYAISDPEKAG